MTTAPKAGSMSELEIRILAAEIVATEIAPWIDADKIADALASIRAGLMFDIGQDEREARMAAIQLLTDGRDRYEPVALGMWIRAGRP
jgi:hypothetical protein